MMEIVRWNAEQAEAGLPDLVGLLRDAVEGGASVGFLPPLRVADAWDYWRGVVRAVRAGQTLLWVARVDGAVLGTVQLVLTARANGLHRAEVSKLLVHSSARRGGLGRALMQKLEEEALALGRTTLVLDTRAGDSADRLYRRLGWQESGRVPRYARSATGALHTTVFFYKLLGDDLSEEHNE